MRISDWSSDVCSSDLGSPTLSNGNVYVVSQDNQIFALNAENGDLGWTESGTLEVTGVFGVAAPAAGPGTVIVGYSSGELTAYRYDTGRHIWGHNIGRASRRARVVHNV